MHIANMVSYIISIFSILLQSKCENQSTKHGEGASRDLSNSCVFGRGRGGTAGG
jgi:hypothetical protein